MKHVIGIDPVVAQNDVWFGNSLPFKKMKVKILAREGGNALAVSNLAVRNLTSRERDGFAGLGSSVEKALDDLLPRFFDLARENTPPSGLTESDFEWSAAEGF